MNLIADRLNRISPSQTIAISSKARALKAEGRGHHLPLRRRTGFRYARRHQTGRHRRHPVRRHQIHRRRRHPALRHAVAEKFKRDSGLDSRPKRSSSRPAASRSSSTPWSPPLNAGDEVIIPSPCWVSYRISSPGRGKPVIVPCSQNNGFKCARGPRSGDHAQDEMGDPE